MFEPVFKIRKPTCSSHDNYASDTETESDDGEDFFASLKNNKEVEPEPQYKFEDFFADISTTIVEEPKKEEEEPVGVVVEEEQKKEEEVAVVVPIKTTVEKAPNPKRRRTVPKPVAVILENEPQ